MGDRYREMEILTASPIGLVVRLYDEAIHNCRAAAAHQDAGRVAERGRAITQAMAIVGELREALDHERGGEIARNLESLYVFVLDQLVEANVARDVAGLVNAASTLTELQQGWREIQRSGATHPGEGGP